MILQSSFLPWFRKLAPAAGLLAGLALFSFPAVAGVGVWTPVGPDGGTVRALAVHPRTPEVVLAGTATNGVFRSTDAGATWASSSQGLGLPGRPDPVVAVKFDPLRPDIAYAVTDFGVFKSRDAGRRWASSARGLPAGIRLLSSLAIDPRNSNRLYLGSPEGVFRSQNAGASWQGPLAGTAPPSFVTSLMIDPTSGWVFAGTRFAGLLVSQDGGTRWQAFGRGIPVGAEILVLEVADRGPISLFAATSRGLFRSDDRGRRWRQVGASTINTAFRALAFDGRTGRLYGGGTGLWVLASDDRGASWHPFPLGVSTPAVLALATGPSAVYAGTMSGEGSPGGLFKSDDRGVHWRLSQRGLSAIPLWKIAASPATPDLLLASSETGLYRSCDAGRSWQLRQLPPPLSPPANPVVQEIVFDPFAPATVYAFAPLSGHNFFLQSDDDGEHWQVVELPGVFLFDLWADRGAPETLWGAGASLQLFRSTDGGLSWTQRLIDGPLFSAVSMLQVTGDPENPAVLYVAGSAVTGIRPITYAPRFYRSDDGGETWQRKDTGLSGNGYVPRLTVDPDDGARLYLALPGRLFRSHDRGDSWEPVLGPLPAPLPENAGPVLAAPASPATLYAATNQPATGLLMSVDGGDTWTPQNLGLGTARPITDLIFDPARPERIYAATANGGLFTFDAP